MNLQIPAIPTPLLLMLLTILAGCGGGEERVTLLPDMDDGIEVSRAGDTIRIHSRIAALDAMPVAVSWSGEAPGCLESEGQLIPVQLENGDSGEQLIWFLADVPSGGSRDYQMSEQSGCSQNAYSWEVIASDQVRLMAGNQPLVDYIHPRYDEDDVGNTHKPFHHLFGPASDLHITKGFGGRYPHHKGIFFGYSKIRFNGEEVNIWSSNNGERAEHQRTLREWTGPVFGGHQLAIAWKDREGDTFAEETRSLRAFNLGDGRTLLDMEFELRSLVGKIELTGDHHHAGVQFRASQYVNDHGESSFLRPAAWADFPGDAEMERDDYVDLPWNAFQFRVEGEPFTVGYLSHPSNPSGGEMSERLYGRFGEFIPSVIDEQNPLRLRYRFLVANGDELSREDLEAAYAAYSGLVR